MMAHLLVLEEFESAQTDMAFGFDTGPGASPQALRADGGAGLVSYEKGYEAGWDDASNAASQDQDRITSEFSHNLQDLGFTFHEARSHVIHSMGPLLAALVEKLLPDLVAKTMSQRIIEELSHLTEQAADTPIQIVVAPNSQAALEPLIAAVTSCPFEICPEPSLGPGQVFLRSGKIEKRIDLEQAILNIGEAVSAIQSGNAEAFAHG